MSNFVPLFDVTTKKIRRINAALKTENQRIRYSYMNGYIVYETDYNNRVVSRMSRK